MPVASIFSELPAPDFVNETGVKWWLLDSVTTYAQRPSQNGRLFATLHVWLTQLPDGTKKYLLTDGDDIVAEHRSIEGIGAKIDAHRAKLIFT